MVYYIYVERKDDDYGWVTTSGVYPNSRTVPEWCIRTKSELKIPYEILDKGEYGLYIPNDMAYLGSNRCNVYSCSAKEVMDIDSNDNIISVASKQAISRVLAAPILEWLALALINLRVVILECNEDIHECSDL